MLYDITGFRQKALQGLHNEEEVQEHNGWFNYSLALISIITVVLVNITN